MTRNAINRTEELSELRQEIDAVDARIIAALAARMAVIDKIVALKHDANLPAFIPDRVEQVIQNVRSQAKIAGLSPELAERLWRNMMDWVIVYEKDLLDTPKR